MADLVQNTQYGSPGTQSSPMADFSGISKAIQERTSQASSNTVQSALNSHFNPALADSMFGSPMVAPFNTPDAPSTAAQPGGLAPYGTAFVQGQEGATPP